MWVCVIDIGGSWDELLPLIKFAYNNSYHSSVGMTPYEAPYGRPCRSLVCWDKVRERRLIRPKLIEETATKIMITRDNLRIAQCKQKSYGDNRRRELVFEIGDHVFLNVSPMKEPLRFEKK